MISTGERSLDQDTANGGLSKSFESVDPKAPKAQSRRSDDFVHKASSKRILEVVAESQSCVHDCVSRSLTRAERKKPKRSFHEYSTSQEDTHLNLDRGQNFTSKKHQLSSD